MSELVRVCFCHWTCPCLPVLIIYGMWIYCERELDRIDIICAQYSIPYSCAVSQSLTIVWVYLCWYLGAQVFAVISNLFVSVILYLTCAKERIIKRFQILPGYVAYGITANASLWSLLVYNGCTEFGISNCDSTLLNMHWQHLFVISYSGSLHMQYVHSCLNLADLIISFCFLATAAESSTLTSVFSWWLPFSWLIHTILALP